MPFNPLILTKVAGSSKKLQEMQSLLNDMKAALAPLEEKLIGMIFAF